MKFKVGDIVQFTQKLRVSDKTWTVTGININTVTITRNDHTKLTLYEVFTDFLGLVVPTYVQEFDEEWKRLTNE